LLKIVFVGLFISILIWISIFFVQAENSEFDNIKMVENQTEIISNKEPKIVKRKYILQKYVNLEETKMMKLKENSENRRLQINRFREIQNEIFERHKRVEFSKNLIFRQNRNIDKNIFSNQNYQKKYLYQQKKREAQKQMLKTMQGSYNDN